MPALTLFRRVFLAALLAGLVAGVVGWGARQVAVVPLILQAEVFEHAAQHAQAPSSPAQAGQTQAGQTQAGPAQDAHHHDDEGWRPGDGAPRMLFTLVTDLFAALAFALVLSAVILLGGARIDPWRGLAWGLGGFVAVSLVPSLYMPPELPGTDGGGLQARQIWWVFAVAATAAGLLLARFARGPAWYALAVLLLMLPHVSAVPVSHGALPAAIPGSGPPAELASRFVAAVLACNAVFWLSLGAVTGFFHRRIVGAGAQA